MAPSEQVTIFHNPKCSTSNHAMATADELGVAHDTVLYLRNRPTRRRCVASSPSWRIR